jgi:hypothetical protein
MYLAVQFLSPLTMILLTVGLNLTRNPAAANSASPQTPIITAIVCGILAVSESIGALLYRKSVFSPNGRINRSMNEEAAVTPVSADRRTEEEKEDERIRTRAGKIANPLILIAAMVQSPFIYMLVLTLVRAPAAVWISFGAYGLLLEAATFISLKTYRELIAMKPFD